MREFSFRAMVLGAVLAALLAVANTYVGLKVGMVVSASIPAAVISMAVLRGVLRRGTILENNIVQTIGSSGESLAAGMIFTIPAIFMLQPQGQGPSLAEMTIWGAVGGLLGICIMVPLRGILIVREHGKLPYPEGTACAEVLRAGETGSSGADKVFWGLGVGAVYELFRRLGFWNNYVNWPIASRELNYRTGFSLDASPALLGVGYILGPRVAAYIMGGAAFGWFLLIPTIAYFGAGNPKYEIPGAASFADFFQRNAASDEVRHAAYASAAQLHKEYIKQIGAGAVAAGGLISLIKSGPTMVASILTLFASLFGASRGRKERTQRDLPILLLLLIVAGLFVAMWKLPQIGLSHIGAIMVVIGAFFFVTVAARIVGIVGASSNPISGMTIATILATSLVFLYYLAPDAGPDAVFNAKIQALSVGVIVCVAAGIAGDTSQDLKTGYLVQATPWKQQAAEFIGVLGSCFVVAYTIQLLSRVGFGGEQLPAPQADIMRTIVNGVMDGQLPWLLILFGALFAVGLELLFGIPALPVAVGLYLPLGISTAIMTGGAIRGLVRGFFRKRESAADGGVLTASGFVAAEGLVGVALQGLAVAYMNFNPNYLYQSELMAKAETFSTTHVVHWIWQWLGWESWYYWGLEGRVFDLLPFAPFLILGLWLFVSGMRGIRGQGGGTGQHTAGQETGGGGSAKFTRLPRESTQPVAPTLNA